MKTLFLLRGLPGSGKTTVAELLSRKRKHTVCSADDYFLKEDNHGNTKYVFDGSKLEKAHKSCQIQCQTAMMLKKKKIFVANTFTTEEELKYYYDLAEMFGYMVVSLIVENRHNGKSIHNVPEKTFKKMKKRFNIKL